MGVLCRSQHLHQVFRNQEDLYRCVEHLRKGVLVENYRTETSEVQK